MRAKPIGGEGGRIKSSPPSRSVLNSKYHIDEAHFTNWMLFQPFNLIEEISPKPESMNTNT